MSSLAARAPKMVERRHGDASLAMGLGPQPPPAMLPTRMPMLPAGPCNHHRLHDASIAADPASRPRRRRSSRSTTAPPPPIHQKTMTELRASRSRKAHRPIAVGPLHLHMPQHPVMNRRAARGRMVGEQGKMRSQGLVGAPDPSTLVEKINRRGKRKRKIMVGRWLVGCCEPYH
jgi:hypothetical protein